MSCQKRQLVAAHRHIKNWKIVMELGRRALDHHGLTDWSFDVRPMNAKGVYTRRKYQCGERDAWCVWGERLIELDWQLLRASEAYILQAIHHEIAHALIGRYIPHHGPRWQKKARELGVSEENIAWGVECDRQARESAKKH